MTGGERGEREREDHERGTREREREREKRGTHTKSTRSLISDAWTAVGGCTVFPNTSPIQVKSRAIDCAQIFITSKRHKRMAQNRNSKREEETLKNTGRLKLTRGSKGLNMRKAILSIAVEEIGRSCLITAWLDSNHSCGRLLNKECKSATIFPTNRSINKESLDGTSGIRSNLMRADQDDCQPSTNAVDRAESCTRV